MRVGRWVFRPPLWAALLTFALLCVLLALGNWQLQRGQAKAAIIAERAAAGKMPPLALAEALQRPLSEIRGRQLRARGHYLGDRQLLQDNQVYEGRAGYHVWTPLQLQGSQRLVMVNRGWVPLGRKRSIVPNPAAASDVVQVQGYWRDWPRPGLRLDGEQACKQAGWPRVVNYPRHAEVACHYPVPVADGLLLLAEGAAGGFARDWQQLGIPPRRHYGYAVQWFALALALVAIFLIMNTRRKT